MLAYASPGPGREAAHPRTLMLIVAAHVAAIGAVMLARSDIVTRHREPPIVLTPVPIPPDPPVNRPARKVEARPTDPVTTKPIVDAKPHTETPPLGRIDDLGQQGGTTTGSITGTGTGTTETPPAHQVERRAPVMLTSGDALRPPYPESKRMLAEEAMLTLKLSIDAAGRVVAVEPIGRADAVFLASARKHLLRVWRFSPATDDGTAVPSTKVITLRFELDEE